MRNKKCAKKAAKFVALMLTLVVAFTSMPMEVFAGISATIGGETTGTHAQKSESISVDAYVAQVTLKQVADNSYTGLLSLLPDALECTLKFNLMVMPVLPGPGGRARVVSFNPQGGRWPAPANTTATLTRTIPAGGALSNILRGNVLLNPTQNPPTRSGHVFVGWSLRPGGARIGNSIPAGTGPLALHAIWRRV